MPALIFTNDVALIFVHFAIILSFVKQVIISVKITLYTTFQDLLNSL